MLKNNSNKFKAIFAFFIFLILMATNAPSFAMFGWDYISGSKNDPNSEYHERFPLQFNDDITSDQELKKIKLTPEQQHEALVWGLSEDQEKRYVFLMQNRTGLYYKNIKLSPVEILGINARDNNERVFYAKLLATQEFEKNAKLLAFDAAYHNAAVELKEELKLPVIRDFDYSKYSPYNYKPLQLQNSDKLVFFISKGDGVKPIVSSLISEIKKNQSLQLNVFFVDKGLKDDEITKWAKSQNIPSDMVNSKRTVTLNHDKGQYEEIKIKNKKTPLLILIRNGQSSVVNISRF